MSRILIEYGPLISDECMENIQNNFSESMVAIDGSSRQYRLEDMLEDIGDLFSVDDRKVLDQLVAEDVEYIEI